MIFVGVVCNVLPLYVSIGGMVLLRVIIVGRRVIVGVIGRIMILVVIVSVGFEVAIIVIVGLVFQVFIIGLQLIVVAVVGGGLGFSDEFVKVVGDLVSMAVPEGNVCWGILCASHLINSVDYVCWHW